jgi:hypothetical protein
MLGKLEQLRGFTAQPPNVKKEAVCGGPGTGCPNMPQFISSLRVLPTSSNNFLRGDPNTSFFPYNLHPKKGQVFHIAPLIFIWSFFVWVWRV